MNGINLSSKRARQARQAVIFSAKGVKLWLVVISMLFVVAGILGFFFSYKLSLILIAFALMPIMPVLWARWYLNELPINTDAGSLDGTLEWEVLGRLSANTTTRQLAQSLVYSPGGVFMAMHFGVSPNFLAQLSVDEPVVNASIWTEAVRLQNLLGVGQISGAIVVAALANVLPGRDKILAQFQLSYDDIVAGAHWYHHLKDLGEQEKSKPNRSGGIGRDLSFGFTPLLDRLAVNVTNQVSGGTMYREIVGHQQLLNALANQLAGGGRHNAVLVGPAGVGKTTLVYGLAEKLINGDSSLPPDLKYRQVIMLDPANLLANAPKRGQIEGLLTQLFNEAYQAKNIILFFDNAELFFSDGPGSIDVRNVLMPIIEGGALRIVLSIDQHYWLRLSQESPSLAQQLNRINVTPLSQEDIFLVCQDQVLGIEFRHTVTYFYQAIKAAYRLGGRYVQDLAMPGQALATLEAAARFSEEGFVTAKSVEKAVEQMTGAKVSVVNEDHERQMLLGLENLIHQRMVNQTRAVNVVANALRRARSGVRNQNRPIGSFMFLGPTGVGKTELSKALAAVYFGGEDHMVRLDLNEYGQADDVVRLIADAKNDPHSLTAQISRQPFSVVLLDEIEKAHANVLNTLLQLLDEGILRDTNGREVSFRDSIIIATSNAGADKIRSYIAKGNKLEQFEDEFVNQLIDSGQFKPEFLNRFDEIIVFRPLTTDELMQVVDLILAGVNQTLAQQHVRVEVADDARRKLVEVGNDPRLGARPLRRVVQRTVENIMARKLLQGQAGAGSVVNISLSEVEEALNT